MPQALSHDYLMVRVSMTWAAPNSMVRTIASPHFEMLPIRSISPDWCRRGVKPNTAPTALEFLKRAGTSTVARKVMGRNSMSSQARSRSFSTASRSSSRPHG